MRTRSTDEPKNQFEVRHGIINKVLGLPRYVGGIHLSVSWVASWHQAPLVEGRSVSGTSAREDGVDDGVDDGVLDGVDDGVEDGELDPESDEGELD